MSAVNRNILSIRISLLSKIGLTVISTIAAYILIPVAFNYAAGDFNKVLVLAVVLAWAFSLTRMWGEVISLTAQALQRIPVPAGPHFATILSTLPEIELAAGVPLN